MVGGTSIAMPPAPTHRISLVPVSDEAGDGWLAEVEDFPQLSARAHSPEEAARRAWAALEATLERHDR